MALTRRARARVSAVSIPIAWLVLAGCSSDASEQPAPLTSDASPAAVGGLEPVSDWKSERKRLALRGLDYTSGRAVRVPEEAREVLAGLEASAVQELFERGMGELETNHVLEAIATFTRVVLLRPDDGAGYLWLGQALIGWKLEGQAEAAFRTGLDVAPRDAELAFRVADMTWRKGDREAALAGFRAAIALDPRHVEAWGRVARAEFYAERDDAAWEAVHRVEELGDTVPPQMRQRLAARTAEPRVR